MPPEYHLPRPAAHGGLPAKGGEEEAERQQGEKALPSMAAAPGGAAAEAGTVAAAAAVSAVSGGDIPVASSKRPRRE